MLPRVTFTETNGSIFGERGARGRVSCSGLFFFSIYFFFNFLLLFVFLGGDWLIGRARVDDDRGGGVR